MAYSTKGTTIGRIFATVVGSSPNRYGLIILRGEPETGADATAQGIVQLHSYDHDGSGDDVLRGSFSISAGTAAITLNDTGASAVNVLTMNQTQVILNDQGVDVDTIIEGENVTDVLKVDAGLDQVLVGTTIAIKERADQQADIAGYGQLWVKNTTPCELWFTDDAGTDTQLA